MVQEKDAPDVWCALSRVTALTMALFAYQKIHRALAVSSALDQCRVRETDRLNGSWTSFALAALTTFLAAVITRLCADGDADLK